MKKHLFILLCLFFIPAGLFAQSLETDKGNATTPEVTGQNAALDGSAGNEELGMRAVMAVDPAPEELVSPDAANPTLGREVNSGIDYYTGAANINVDLYTVSSRGISIPVSVKYTASGVKVEEYPGCVGDNWNLTGGGRITRTVMGQPDEKFGYYYEPQSLDVIPVGWNEEKIKQRVRDKIDTEPDLYRFELPTGVSGMFILDKGGVITLLPYQDLKIEWLHCPAPADYPTYCYIDPDDPQGKVWEGHDTSTWEYWERHDDNNRLYNAKYFIITDAQGIKYHFGSNEDYKEFSYNEDFSSAKKYISSWLLRRITYQGKEIARYTYSSYRDYNKTYLNGVQRHKFKASNNSVEYLNTVFSTTKTKISPKEMKEIIWDLGKLEFSYNDLSSSGLAPKLTHIDVYGCDSIAPLKSIYVEVGPFGVISSALGYHARINRIYEKSGNNVRNICAFQYYDNGDHISGPGDHEADYWGYWNGFYWGSTEEQGPMEQYSILGHNFNSSFRKPTLAHVRCGTLQKIIYPTGGWTEFEYELHTYRINNNTGYIPYTASGLRTKSITHYSGLNSAASTTQYVYESPNSFINGDGGRITSSYKPFARFRKDTGSGTGREIIFSLGLKPDFPMTDFTGSPVVYNYVKEILPNGSYTTYQFVDIESFPDLKGYVALGTSSGVGSASPDWQYRVPSSTKFYGRGLLKKVANCDSSDQMVYQEEYSYDYGNVKSSVNVYSSFVTDEESGSPKYYRGNYQWISQPVFLASKTASSSRAPKIITEYFYNPSKDLLPREIIERHEISTPDYVKTTVTYPQDYTYSGTPTQGTEADGIVQLQKIGVKVVPIETIRYKKNYGEANWNVMGAQINIYKWNQTAGMPVLEQTKSLIVNALSPTITKSSISGDLLVKDSRYDTYNSQNISFNKQGNPEFITLSGSSGLGTRIIYGYDGLVPVGYITNTLQSSVGHVYCTSFEKGCYSTPNNTVFLGNRAKSGEYALKKGVAHNILLTLTPHVISYWRWDGNDNTTWEEVRKVVKTAVYIVKEPNHYVDEVRAIPVDASMTTQVITPGVGVISKVDEKGQAVRYEYNGLGMLESVALDGQILGKYSYIEGSESYSLSANVASGSSGRGTASVTPVQVNAGGSATFTATPSTGYQFSQWQFSDGTTSANAVTVRNNIRFDLTGTASFVEYKQSYNMSAVVAGISAGRGTASVTPAQVSEGGSATWSATASVGSVFDRWEFSDETTATTATTTKTSISQNITGTAYFKDKPKQPVNFHGTIMPRDGYWAVHISCYPDIISYGEVKVYATGYFFINPDTPERIDAQFNGQVSEDGYVLSNARFDENNSVGELNGTISFNDLNYTVGTVSWN